MLFAVDVHIIIITVIFRAADLSVDSPLLFVSGSDC